MANGGTYHLPLSVLLRVLCASAFRFSQNPQELNLSGRYIVTNPPRHSPRGQAGTALRSGPAHGWRMTGAWSARRIPQAHGHSHLMLADGSETRPCLEHLRRDAALGVIPFEFAADYSKIGAAGVRLIVAKTDRRFSFRQLILERRLIQPVWTYVIGDAISRGLLPPIAGWWKIGTVPPRRVSVDAGREAQQNRADVERGKPCQRR